MNKSLLAVAACLTLNMAGSGPAQTASSPSAGTPAYCVVDTGQVHCFGDRGQLLKVPRPGEPFSGQDAFYQGPKPAYRDNGDGTISDLATGLMWSKADSHKAMNWQQSLAWCEKLKLAGHDDWRLPNAKELQSIVDYTRAPDAQDPARRGPAIDPIFEMSDGEAWFWTSTTHLEGPGGPGAAAAYIAFGRATGFMPGPGGRKRAINVHGAGAQRSDPKSGDPKSPQWASGLGPQGDEIRIFNYARAVRNIDPDAVRFVQPSVTPLPPSARPPHGQPGGPPGFPPGRRR